MARVLVPLATAYPGVLQAESHPNISLALRLVLTATR